MNKLNVPKASIDHEKAYDTKYEGEIARSYEILKDIMEAGGTGFCSIGFSEFREKYLENLEKKEEAKGK